jgi:hypothetical protein
MKNKRLKDRNRMFTVPAKGGAPSGQIWPNNTIKFKIINMIKIAFSNFIINDLQLKKWFMFFHSHQKSYLVISLSDRILRFPFAGQDTTFGYSPNA